MAVDVSGAMTAIAEAGVAVAGVGVSVVLVVVLTRFSDWANGVIESRRASRPSRFVFRNGHWRDRADVEFYSRKR